MRSLVQIDDWPLPPQTKVTIATTSLSMSYISRRRGIFIYLLLALKSVSFSHLYMGRTLEFLKMQSLKFLKDAKPTCYFQSFSTNVVNQSHRFRWIDVSAGQNLVKTLKILMLVWTSYNFIKSFKRLLK